MLEDNKQLLVSVTNLYTLEQTWWNEARTNKPQTFVAQVCACVHPCERGVETLLHDQVQANGCFKLHAHCM